MISILPDIIRKSAKKFPQKVAYKCGLSSLTYLELDTKSNQLAKFLISSGIKQGNLVGIYMNRSIESVIAVYGILKAGAAFVPLDPLAPNNRTVFLINDCEIQVLLTIPSQKKQVSKILKSTSKINTVIGLSTSEWTTTVTWEQIFNLQVEIKPNPQITSDDLAYIMFTSGSTGNPKGIMHTHKSALAYARLSSELYQVSHKDIVANHAPLHFDISTFGYFSAPYASATTIIIPDAYTKMPASLSALISKEEISIWYSVPLAIIQLYLSNTLKDFDYKLRWVLFGGENFTMKYLNPIRDIWPNTSFSNVYGPAEVNQCTYYNFNSKTKLEQYVPIGQIWNETDFLIIDKNDKVVSSGETGEFVVSAPTMMKGYWKNPELTNKSLLIKHSKTSETKVYYRTGDLVKLDQNDQLVFLGRNDRQTKIRGYRIEMDEIEIIINEHQKVKEARVCEIMDMNFSKSLAAAIVPLDDVLLDQKEILQHCKSLLPSYAVPSTIEIINQLPRTSSGKIDLNSIKLKLNAL